MTSIMNKGILAGLCLLGAMKHATELTYVAGFLVLVTGTALFELVNDWYKGVILGLELLGILLFPELLWFLPMIFYDFIDIKERVEKLWLQKSMVILVVLLGFLTAVKSQAFEMVISLMLHLLLSWWLYEKTHKSMVQKQRYQELQDDTREEALQLFQKNQELLKNQDYEVQLATLGERNRIAREIHDNVGHLLTRSLFQMEALKVMHAGDEGLCEQLEMVKHTLSEAMDNVRSSVHDLKEEAFDLEMSLRTLVKEFTFCKVLMKYQAEQVPKETGYCILAVVKEGLSNVARHSNATNVRLFVLEHPGLYQVILEDNGTQKALSDRTGMGLSNMEERVTALGGIFRIERENGYRIFLSIPKKERE